MQRIIARLGVLLVAICRTAFWCGLIVWSTLLIYVVCSGSLKLVQTHLVSNAANVENVCSALFSLVWGVACWAVFRSKPRLVKWAIAANLIILLAYFPALLLDWWGILRLEFYLWSVALFVILGIIIFRIPHSVSGCTEDPTEVSYAGSLRMPQLQRFLPAGSAVRLLAICRTVYSCIFFLWTCSSIYVVCSNIRSLVRTHSIERGDIIGNATIATYSVVMGVAWWMIVRGRAASKQWAIAANLTFIFTWLPALLFGKWRAFLGAERNWWPFIVFGIFGIIIFSIPYHGWRHKSQAPMIET